VAGVSAGMMTSLHAERCYITATLTIQGAQAIQKSKRIALCHRHPTDLIAVRATG